MLPDYVRTERNKFIIVTRDLGDQHKRYEPNFSFEWETTPYLVLRSYTKDHKEE